jgi:hypothetical protein
MNHSRESESRISKIVRRLCWRYHPSLRENTITCGSSQCSVGFLRFRVVQLKLGFRHALQPHSTTKHHQNMNTPGEVLFGRSRAQLF